MIFIKYAKSAIHLLIYLFIKKNKEIEIKLIFMLYSKQKGILSYYVNAGFHC